MAKSKRAAALSRDELLEAGESHFLDGSYGAALSCFETVLSGDAKDVEAYYLKARALYYLQREDEAENAFDGALRLAPDYAPALIHKAELLVRSYGWPNDALDLIEQAERTDLGKEDRIEAAFVRGLAHLELGEHAAAIAPLSDAVQGDQEWAEAIRERAICWFYLWKFDDARKDLERVLQLDSGDPEAHFFLAMALERLGRYDDAQRAYALASELDPSSFHKPCRVSRDVFMRAANDAIEELPEEFRLRFDPVSFAVEDLPSKSETVQPDVQGLFDGAPLITGHVGLAPPCRVRLFQKNIERMSPDLPTLKEEIARTVLVEVGNFFGLQEVDFTRLQVH